MSYKDIALGMFRTGILGFGGGPSVIPLIRYEAVIRYKWVGDEEFAEILAIANALPGPIATKMAAYLGYKQRGWMGAFVSICAHILPTSLAIVALLGVLYSFSSSKYVAGMIYAVRPVIVVMLGMMAYEFMSKAWKGLGKGFAIAFALIAALLLTVLDIHPGIVIALYLAYGAFHLKWFQRKAVPDKGASR
ncbi:chromate transporter [Paenibacillus sp. LMG 31456]|uniref:Chromate transporter n=1 Tax=Paenibacillus foliorum TaxID=2654974 RepID=A0A972GNG8_9BACL|nr:chromate transporter [Paenibacillus foliorum]NOU93912.1 chromate transporter [Paenibacillus foliorum]